MQLDEFITKNIPHKHKAYLLFLFGKQSLEAQKRLLLTQNIATQTLPGYMILKLNDPIEVLKLLILKTVSLILIDYSFLTDHQATVDFIVECKKRSVAPVFFLIPEERSFIPLYKKKLSLYERYDEYFLYPLDEEFLSAHLRGLGRSRLALEPLTSSSDEGLFPLARDEEAHLHRSKHDLSFISLFSEKKIIPGFLEQISSTSFQFVLAEDNMNQGEEELFKRGQQLQIKIPTGPYFHFLTHQQGEFVQFTGRLERLSICGNRLYGSLLYLTESQIQILTKMIKLFKT